MSHPTDERVGHRMVFALAQIPYTHQHGQLIASLAPLMDLETGDTFDSRSGAFPADGYVFWGAVPHSDLAPGDLVVGTLRQASGTFYGSQDQSWYQVSMEADSPHGEVFEYVKTNLDADAGLRRLVDGRKMIDAAHNPPKLFFIWVNEQLVGPFQPQHLAHFQSPTGYCCVPNDRVNSIVKVAAGAKLSQYVRNEIGYCEVHLSSNTYHPGKGPSGRFVRRYRLIRKEDIASYTESTQEVILPTDEFAIRKACNLLMSRKESSAAKEQLNALVEKLRTEERQIESGVVEAITEIAGRIAFSETEVVTIGEALSESEQVQGRIDALVSERVAQQVAAKSATIEAEARKQAEQALEELSQVEKAIEEVERQRAAKLAEFDKYNREIDEKQAKFENFVAAAAARMDQGRQELLCDLGLLGPLFHSAAGTGSNGHVISNGLASPQAAAEVTTLDGEAITEADFVERRLLPKLHECGASLATNKAFDFHALLVASRMVQLPDVSWAVAYTEAMGGSAVCHCVAVEPDWMTFTKVYSSELGTAFGSAIKDAQRLHIIVVDGIDRCPSHAWLRPWIQLVAGWRRSLPHPANCDWPDNLRLVFTEDNSAASFATPAELSRWIVPFAVETIDQPDPGKSFVDGHLPFESWVSTTVAEDDFAFDALLKEVEAESSCLDARLRRQLTRRLRDVYLRLGRDEDRLAGPIKWLLRPIQPPEAIAE